MMSDTADGAEEDREAARQEYDGAVIVDDGVWKNCSLSMKITVVGWRKKKRESECACVEEKQQREGARLRV